MMDKDKGSKVFVISNLYFLNSKKKLLINPSYQRTPVWTLSQKQLLIDSLLHDIDIPKLYFRKINNKNYEFEVVDGQQRLRSIFEFLGGQFKISKDSDKVGNKNIAELAFDELDTDLQMAFNNKQLDVVILNEGYTTEDIEEMFLRLQNGTPLNAAEKRRAIQGNVRDIVKKLSKHKIFKLCVFSEKRYGHEDAIAKISHIVLKGTITDIKPASIKNTYEYYRNLRFSDQRIKQIQGALNFIYGAFKRGPSPRLKKFSIIDLTQLAIYLLENYDVPNHKKEFSKAYLKFQHDRIKNEELPEDKQNGNLSAYTDAARSDSIPNMKYRNEYLLRILIQSIPDMKLKDPKRLFTEEQKMAIYYKDQGICQICQKKCREDEFEADHIISYSKGGETKISNGQLTCFICNRKKSKK